MAARGQRDQVLAPASDAAVLTVAVVAAQSCQHHRERALQLLRRGGSLSGALSVPRCNRRLHRRRAWLLRALETPGAIFAAGAAFLLDSLPVPAGRRARARRCRKPRGQACCGACAAKREQCFGWRRHLVCTTAGVPVACDLLPGGRHDLPPAHELTYGLPDGAACHGDQGDNAAADAATILAATGGRLVPIRKAKMRPNDWADKRALRDYRQRIAARYSQLEAMGARRLRARTTPRLERKLHAAPLAVTIANAA